MTLPNQQIGLTRPLLTSLVLENLDHVGRWTDEKGAYEAKALLAQDFFCPQRHFFSSWLYRDLMELFLLRDERVMRGEQEGI